MTELELHQPTNALTDVMDYARAVSTAALLPQAYRGKPADIMLAVGLGQAMGLSPAESLYRIDVIQGKPTASAELIAANVRKAGHKLRVRGDESSATATIVRADDPDFEFTVTRDVNWAREMGLLTKDNYKKQRGTMLQWRAISAVARLACPEALYGVAYTPDEMDDMPRTAPSGGLGAALAAQEQPTEPEPQDDVQDAEIVEESQQPSDPIQPNQLKKLQILLRECGVTDRDDALAYYARVTGREVDSSKALTRNEAGQVLSDLERVKNGEPNLLDPANANDPALDLGDAS